MALIEIDGLAFLKMVDLSMAMLNNQIVTLVAGAIISVKNQIIV
jgi:hypothetical protein